MRHSKERWYYYWIYRCSKYNATKICSTLWQNKSCTRAHYATFL